MGLKLINDYVVIVSGRKLIKQLYNREELNSRPDGFFFRIRTFNERLGIVFTDGRQWEDQRNFSVKTLKSLGFGKSSMIEHIENEAKELALNLEKQCNHKIHIQRADSNIFDISVMNVMWTLLRGERFKLDDEQVIRLMETIHRSFQIVDMSGGILSQLPWLRFLAPVKTGYRPLIETMKPLWNFLKEDIGYVLKTYKHKHVPTNFIEFYCREIENRKETESFFTEDQLLALCVDFFQAGSETTSNTLAFGILYMLHHPHVMEKVQEELQAVVGVRFPKLSDRQHLKYTEATICEIQRIANVAPLGELVGRGSRKSRHC